MSIRTIIILGSLCIWYNNTTFVVDACTVSQSTAENNDQIIASSIAWNISKGFDVYKVDKKTGKNLFEQFESVKSQFPLAYQVLHAGVLTKEITIQLLKLDKNSVTAEIEEQQLRKLYRAACETIACYLPDE